MAEVIRLVDIVKSYIMGDSVVHALDHVNVQIGEGEFTSIMGPSGSGKSTMMNILGCLDRPTSGHYFLRGRDIAGYNDDELAHTRNAEIGFVFQNFNLLPKLTAQVNVALPLVYAGINEEERMVRAARALESVGLGNRLDHKPNEMSGGQRQRVAIGRAIVRDPAVFLMDEPLSNLDAKLRNQMRAELIKLRERIDTTFIYVTHDQTEAMTLGDRIVIMKDGFIQQIGTPQEVFDHPANLFVAGFIGTPQMNLFDAHLARKDGKYTVTVGSVTVELSEEKQQRLAAKDVAEQDVVLGVRPDHIMLCADGVKGKVDVSEMMGSSVHLHVAAEGKDVIVIVPTNGAAAHFPAGSEVNMIFGGNVAHVFSKETEKNLEW